MKKILLSIIFFGQILSTAAQFSGASGGNIPAQAGQGGKFLQTDGTATSWQTASGGSGATKTYTASQALALGDILEVWNDAGVAKVRKAAQVTQTTGMVYNNQVFGTGIQAVYNYQINATTFGSLSTDGLTYTTRTTTYNAGAGTFAAGTLQVNNATLPNNAGSVSTTNAWNGQLVGSGPRALLALPTSGTMLFWVLNKATGTLTGGTTAGTPQGGASYAVSAFETDNPDIIGCQIWHNNGGSMVSGIVINISSGTGVNVTSSSNNPTSESVVNFYVANVNRSFVCPAGGSQRFGFRATSTAGGGATALTAVGASSTSNIFNAGVTNISAAFFPSGLQVVGQNGNDIFVLLQQGNGNCFLYKWTCTSASGGVWSGQLAAFAPTGGMGRQAVQLTGNKFIQLSSNTTSSILQAYADIYSLNTTTGAVTLAANQTYTLTGSAGEKEAVNNSNVVFDANGNGIFAFASYGDPGYIVGFADAFIGTVNN
ncbi:MAG: hypothetical protein ACRC3K_10225, partial [Plesiomonas sp.]